MSLTHFTQKRLFQQFDDDFFQKKTETPLIESEQPNTKTN